MHSHSNDNDNGDATSNPLPSPARAEVGKKVVKVVEEASPVAAAKAVKNEAELEGMREAHLRDAVAICQFLCCFEGQVGRWWVQEDARGGVGWGWGNV